MMYLRSLMLFAFAAALSVSSALRGGELENFEDDVNFLIRNHGKVNSLPADSPYRRDYIRRLSGASNRAHDIQAAAMRMGIKGINLHGTFAEVYRSLNLTASDTNATNLRDAAEEGKKAVKLLMKQIAMLKKMNFSYENRSYTPLEDDGSSGEEDALDRFSKLIDEVAALAGTRTTASGRRADESVLREMASLAAEIGVKVHNSKIKLSPDYNFSRDIQQFFASYAKMDSPVDDTAKTGNNSKNNRKGGRRTAVESEAAKEFQYALERLKRDVEVLKASGFTMTVGKTPATPAKTTSAVPEETAPADNTESVDKKQLFEKYEEMKNEVYNSESRMNGVSLDLYEKYSRLLTPLQRKQLTAVYNKNLNDGYPENFARLNAVSKMHSVYKGKIDAYSAAELEQLTTTVTQEDQQ